LSVFETTGGPAPGPAGIRPRYGPYARLSRRGPGATTPAGLAGPCWRRFSRGRRLRGGRPSKLSTSNARSFDIPFSASASFFGPVDLPVRPRFGAEVLRPPRGRSSVAAVHPRRPALRSGHRRRRQRFFLPPSAGGSGPRTIVSVYWHPRPSFGGRLSRRGKDPALYPGLRTQDRRRACNLIRRRPRTRRTRLARNAKRRLRRRGQLRPSCSSTAITTYDRRPGARFRRLRGRLVRARRTDRIPRTLRKRGELRSQGGRDLLGGRKCPQLCGRELREERYETAAGEKLLFSPDGFLRHGLLAAVPAKALLEPSFTGTARGRVPVFAVWDPDPGSDPPLAASTPVASMGPPSSRCSS